MEIHTNISEEIGDLPSLAFTLWLSKSLLRAKMSGKTNSALISSSQLGPVVEGARGTQILGGKPRAVWTERTCVGREEGERDGGRKGKRWKKERRKS